MGPARWSYDAERGLHWNGCGLDCAVCGGGAVGLSSPALVLAQVVGGGSGGIPGCSGTLGNLTFRSAWRRVVPWASTVHITTPAQQLYSLPHAGQSAGALRRDRAGSSGRRDFRASFFCVSVVGHPGRTNGMCVAWRVAVVVAAVRACAEPQCGGVPAQPLPHERGRVRVRVLSVACCSRAASFQLLPLGTNDAFGQCDHTCGQCVCDLCDFGCPPGCRVVSFVIGHAAVAKDKMHPCVLSSAPQSGQEGHDSTKYRVRCR
ncbi:hypothetical protein MOQ_005137 [Trypanosoma cruzi marinkellei]|uniref:Uncharacterized protein n=1 Tax=Trypanosoma cruzi marinkellei TaxID=85056 RepID=K2MVD8_TRYCR|nr:hypothetical protein MOQ_006570 [Trypanosoma cruzi marinkellei]EKF31032.1 hypothetical protein MOQ_005137 [Trypanosoma cruzi marinkellei]